MKTFISAGLIVGTCLIGVSWAHPAMAQPHGPRPAPAHRPAYGPRPVGPHLYAGFSYGPWYGPYFYSPWVYSSFWWYPPYAYPYFYGRFGANLRVQVQPKSAEVYVDGYLAGIVDQFDGMFQDLVVEPGTHEVIVYHEGYKSIVQRLYLSPGNSYRVKGALEKLAPGEPNEPRPVAARPLPPGYGGELAAPAFQVQADSRFGQLALRVQPGDAEVVIDGDVWKSPPGHDRLVVHLTAGTHRVEVRKEGFDAFVTSVDIKRGETAALNVSLSKL